MSCSICNFMFYFYFETIILDLIIFTIGIIENIKLQIDKFNNVDFIDIKYITVHITILYPINNIELITILNNKLLFSSFLYTNKYEINNTIKVNIYIIFIKIVTFL